MKDKKCVLVIDKSLSIGVIANVAAILSISIGGKIKDLIGPDLTDRDQKIHTGLTQLPIPVLGASGEQLRMLWNTANSDISVYDLVVDFNQLAQQSRTYPEYAESLKSTSSDDITFLGIAILGSRKCINALTREFKLIGG